MQHGENYRNTRCSSPRGKSWLKTHVWSSKIRNYYSLSLTVLSSVSDCEIGSELIAASLELERVGGVAQRARGVARAGAAASLAGSSESETPAVFTQIYDKCRGAKPLKCIQTKRYANRCSGSRTPRVASRLPTVARLF